MESEEKTGPSAEQISEFLLNLKVKTGLDFCDYSPNTMRRQLNLCMQNLEIENLEQLNKFIIDKKMSAAELLHNLTVRTTTMFRDPDFFLALRQRIIPQLQTYPYIKIWLAGCSTGEEVFSLAILLQEEGVFDRCRIYATDFNEQVLDKARAGIYPLHFMQQFTANYIQSGGKQPFSDYYTARFDAARFDPNLIKRTVFAQHNLVTDSSFNEFQLILCRNVLIYFNEGLQTRVYNILDQSLSRLGFLALGKRESLIFSSIENNYNLLDIEQKIYRKIK